MEKVLCIQRNQLPPSWVEPRGWVNMSMDQFVTQCTAAEFAFVDRPQAEQNPALKQVIPYIVLQTRDLSQTAVYNRQGSETRLHDLWSLGIGGHINPEDNPKNNRGEMDFKSLVTAGMERELSEELSLRPAGEKPIFKGIISEDITDVGKVHIGAVFQILTQDTTAWAPGSELHLFQWKQTADLKALNMELWSEMALELLG